MRSEPGLVSPATFLAAVRPTLLFVAAYALCISPHEAAHALCARALGLGSTLHQMWVDPDAAAATTGQLAAIAVAGPVFSLVEGLAFGFLYLGVFRDRPSGLFFLMMALAGTYSFLGPVAGAAIGGDIRLALGFLELPAAMAIALTVVGALALAAFMFLVGRELTRWAPPAFGRWTSVICTTAAPWLAGPPLIVFLYWPLPGFLVASTFTGSVFWAAALAGAIHATPRRETEFAPSTPTKFDLIVLVFAFTMVRMLTHGIRLAP